jgi:hypothetical protein
MIEILARVRVAWDYEFVISPSGWRDSGFPEFIPMDGEPAAQ